MWVPLSAIRKAVEHLLLGGIAIALLTAFINTNAFNAAYDRWQTPLSPGEILRLDQLACVDEFISEIPPNSRVKLIAQIMEWDQRVVEIGYPRISFTSTGQDFYLVVSSIPQDFAPFKCGEGLYVGINENLKCDANLFCSLEG